MRKTRSEYRNEIYYIRDLLRKFNTTHNLEDVNIKRNERMRILIKIFKVFNTNKSIIYKDESLIRVTRKKICFLKHNLTELEKDLNKTLMRKLNNELDETHRILDIYTT
jgi:uncharacterized protein YdaL